MRIAFVFLREGDYPLSSRLICDVAYALCYNPLRSALSYGLLPFQGQARAMLFVRRILKAYWSSESLALLSFFFFILALMASKLCCKEMPSPCVLRVALVK